MKDWIIITAICIGLWMAISRKPPALIMSMAGLLLLAMVALLAGCTGQPSTPNKTYDQFFMYNQQQDKLDQIEQNTAPEPDHLLFIDPEYDWGDAG